MLENIKPHSLNINESDSYIIELNKDFAKSCFRMSKYSNIQNIEDLSVFEYLSLLEDIKKENESIRKSIKTV